MISAYLMNLTNFPMTVIPEPNLLQLKPHKVQKCAVYMFKSQVGLDINHYGYAIPVTIPLNKAACRQYLVLYTTRLAII